MYISGPLLSSQLSILQSLLKKKIELIKGKNPALVTVAIHHCNRQDVWLRFLIWWSEDQTQHCSLSNLVDIQFKYLRLLNMLRQKQ